MEINPVWRAALVAGLGSGAPSLVCALATKRPLLESTRAAGTLLFPADARPDTLLAGGLVSHSMLSVGWSAVLGPLLAGRRRPLLVGGVLGAAVAALDRSIARRWFPRIAALPTVPQVLDHVAFGVLVAATVRSDRAG